MDPQEHRLAHGPDLVWEHVFEFRSGGELPPHLRANPHDHVRRVVKYSSPNECVIPLTRYDCSLTAHPSPYLDLV